MCKHGKYAYNEGSWLTYRAPSGYKCELCVQCMYDLIGHIPISARMMRNKHVCGLCNSEQRVIRFVYGFEGEEDNWDKPLCKNVCIGCLVKFEKTGGYIDD